MTKLATFNSRSSDSKITIIAYATRPILRLAGTFFIFAGLYALLYYLPHYGARIQYENITLIKIISFAGIVVGIIGFYRKCIALNKDSDMLSISRGILFGLYNKQISLSGVDSFYLTYNTCNESPRVPGEHNPSIYSLYIYQLYLRGSDNEQLLVELQESSAPLNDEPYECLIVIEKLAREISVLTGKPLVFSEKIKESLERKSKVIGFD